MSKKKDRIIIIIFVLIGIGLFGYLGYRIKTDFKKEEVVEEKTLRSLDLYGYTLKERDTELYKATFKELEEVLNEEPINYQDYAKKVSELFIIDLYTLNNKLTSTDIGGNEFLHKDLKDNFNEKMGSTLYRNVKNNIDGKRNQNSLKWEYVEDMEYQNTLKVTLIKDNDLLYIVKGDYL